MQQEKHIPNAIDQQLATTIHLPEENNQQRPTVILLCGFTSTKDEPHMLRLAEDLAHHDFNAIRFDVSGYGQSEGDSTQAFKFSHYLNDLFALHAYVRELPFVDKKGIALWGHSIGGTIALLYAAQHEEITAVSCISSPFTITDVIFSTSLDIWKSSGWFTKEKPNGAQVRISYDVIQDAQGYTLDQSLSYIHIPIQVGWGTADTRVPPPSTQRIFNSLQTQKESYELPISHAYKETPEHIRLVNEHVIDFSKRVLNTQR